MAATQTTAGESALRPAFVEGHASRSLMERRSQGPKVYRQDITTAWKFNRLSSRLLTGFCLARNTSACMKYGRSRSH